MSAAPPDAGQTIQNIDPARLSVSKGREPVIDIQQSRPAHSADAGVKIPLTQFSITGISIHTEAELQALVQDGIGKELTLAEVEILAARITQHYRSHGYLLAYAYLPAQDIRDGKIEIAVLEGKYGAVKVRNEGVLDSVPLIASAGEVVAVAPLERGLLLLSDIPGVEVKSTLKPGASVGTSDLIVDVTPGKRLSGSVDFDNYGSRFTGQYRLGATANLNNPTGHGDVFTFRGLTGGTGMNYGRLSYQSPVNSIGTKVGAAYSDMRYELGKNFSSLDAKGTARISSLFAAHPFIRSRSLNLNGQINYDQKAIQDRIDSTSTVTDKKIQGWNIGLSGDNRDGLGGGGVTGFSGTLTLGKLNIESLAAKAIDDLTAKTAGRYSKLALNLIRLQSITNSTSLYLSYSGQVASGNLDSSEKFSTGGSYGVRAYPQGEASADEAHLLTAELRHNLSDGFQLVGFVDTAHTKLIAETWPASTGDNHRTLSGWGLGLSWADTDGYAVKAFYAAKLGNAAATSDTDRDGRFWIQAMKTF